MSEFREILVLGLGRSGSNLLSSILRSIEGNAGFFEIFFERKAQGLQHFPEILGEVGTALGVAEKDNEDPAFLAARDSDPVAFFDILSTAARAQGYRTMSCKIFAKQISIENLERLLQRPGLSVLFLTRSRIDRYISELKGSISKSYVKEDTTGLRPRLDIQKFLATAFRQDRDLDRMQDAVVRAGVRHAYIDYSRDLDQGEAEQFRSVQRALQAVGHAPVFTRTATEGWIVKQDANPDWRDKIENGFETAAALAGLGLQGYAETAPLTGLEAEHRRAGQVADRDPALLEEGGYFFALFSDPIVTFTAIQYGRSFLAEWMAGPEPAFGKRAGVHFLKPTWTMETTDLKPFADCLRRAEACNPGHHFVALHATDTEARLYREAGIRSVPGNANLFTDEGHFAKDAVPHPDLPDTDALYIARLATWKNHSLALGLKAPHFVYGEPVAEDEAGHFKTLAAQFGPESFVNHRVGKGRYHYLGRQELASVMSRSRVALALSQEEGAMRAAVECLLAGLPIVTVPSIGGRELVFTPDTALMVEPTVEAVRAGVAEMLARRLTRDDVRRATMGRVREERAVFMRAANEMVAALLGPGVPPITMEPLLDFTIRYVPLRSMIEALA